MSTNIDKLVLNLKEGDSNKNAKFFLSNMRKTDVTKETIDLEEIFATKEYVENSIPAVAPTTLQEAINAEAAEDGPTLLVNFPSGASIQDGGVTLLLSGRVAIGRGTTEDKLNFSTSTVLNKDVANTDGWLMTGYGEDVGGLGGDYSSLKPNALVPKTYIDLKVATPEYPAYVSTADAAADIALLAGSAFKVTNGDGTSAVHIKD